MSIIYNVFRGDSVPTAKVQRASFVAPIGPSAVYSAWCNGKQVPYVAQPGDGPADVAAGLAAAIASTSISEFVNDMLASVDGDDLLIVAVTAGVPYTVTFTCSTAVTVAETTAGEGPTNEVHQISLAGTYTAGNFTITYNFGAGNVTTANIAWNATAATVQAALVALAGVGAGQVVVTGGPGPNSPWFATWTGTLAGNAVAVGTINGAGLTGTGSVVVTETQKGNGLSNTIQFVDGQNLGAGTFKLTLAGQQTAAIAYNATPATVQTAIGNLPNVGAGNVTVYGLGGGTGSNQDKDYWFVVFNGTLAGTNVAQMTTNTGLVTVATQQTGGQATANDFQVVDLGGATGGTYTVTFQGVTSSPIAVGAGTGTGWVALRNKIQQDAGWTVTGNTVNVLPQFAFDFGLQSNFLVQFQNAEGNLQFPLLSIDGTNLTGGSGVSVTRAAVGKASVNEIQTIVVNGSGGTFTLTLGAQTTAAIAWNAAAATVQTRINTDLAATITTATVAGAGTIASPYTVTVTSPANTPIAVMTGNAGGLSGGGVISELVHGTAGINEVQTITLVGGVNGGLWTAAFKGEPTAPMVWNVTGAQLQAALRATSTINTVTCTGAAGGPWVVTWSGAQASAQQSLIFADGSQLTGATTPLVTVVTTVPSSGPWHWDDPHNWTLGRVPDTGDYVIYESGELDCLYGIAQRSTFTANAATDTLTFTAECNLRQNQCVQLTTTTTLPAGLALLTNYYLLNVNIDAGTCQLAATAGGAAINITDAGTGVHTVRVALDWLEFNSRATGLIGLSRVNPAGYYEYRPRDLRIGLRAAGTQTIALGTGDGSGSQRINIDTGGDQTFLKQVTAGGQLESGIPPVLWQGTHASNSVEILSGDMGVALFAGQVATLGAATCIKIRGGSIALGAGTTVNGAIDQTGGKIKSNGATINGACVFS